MSDMHEFGLEIKPGESLCTPEWDTATDKLSLSAYGLAMTLMALMVLRGWNQIPTDDDVIVDAVPKRLRSGVHRCLPAVRAIPKEVWAGQLAMTKRWPAWLIERALP